MSIATEAGYRGSPLRQRAGGLDVTEVQINAMVHRFYAKVRSDSMLAPLFASIDDDGWERHLAKMCDFWSSVILTSGRYKGAPMAVHAPMFHLQVVHFEKWLSIFRQTVSEIFDPTVAQAIIGKAENIAKSLHYGIASGRGEISSWDPAQNRMVSRLRP